MEPRPSLQRPPAHLADVAARAQRLHQQFTIEARQICAQHAAQTPEQADALRLKYRNPLFGEIQTWKLFEMLAHCVDSSDEALYCVSQETHVLQTIEAMEADGMASEELVLAALTHDIGKVALLKGELPANLFGVNDLLAGAPGCGLDECTLQWSSDDLGWSRLKDWLPAPVAWLVRYHSIVPARCESYLNARDRDFVQRHLGPFQVYDICSKSPFFKPRRRLEDYRPIAEKYLPVTIAF
jgi:hypothetical protein